MTALRDVDDRQSGELVCKKTEACLVGIVFGDDKTQQYIAPIGQDSDGNRIEQFEPGLIAYVRGGKHIKFNPPAATAGVYEWHRVQLHIIAAGWRVPYELMTGDLSQVPELLDQIRPIKTSPASLLKAPTIALADVRRYTARLILPPSVP